MLKSNKTNRTIKVVEKWITKPDGVDIYTKTWKSVVRTPLATVVFLHGLGDHVNRYNHVFERFAAKGVEVFAYDQRGFGQTGARHKNLGHTGGWKVICEDITGFLITQRRPGVPQFLFGHSMGGGLAAMYASDGQERNNVAGIILSSPYFEMAPPSRVPKPTVVLCSALAKVMPNLTITLNLNAKYISRNQSEIERYKNDPLVHSYGSLRGLGDLQSGTKSVLKEKYKNITQPIYICFGSGDGINDFKSAKELFDKIPSKNKTWKEWPEFYHEMHYEDDRYLVINDYLDWIIKTASDSKVVIQNSKRSRNAVSSSSSPVTLAY